MSNICLYVCFWVVVVFLMFVVFFCTRSLRGRPTSFFLLASRIDTLRGGPVELFLVQPVLHDWCIKGRQIVIEETRCRHMGYSFRLAVLDILYASQHRHGNTYHGLCYTRIAHTTAFFTPGWNEKEAQWVHHEGWIRRPIAP